jgi:hypothetical protein
VSLPPDHPLAGRRRAPPFRPSFTLALVYVVAFFLLYAFLLIMPELTAVLRDVAPGPEQERIAQEVARDAFAPRALWALLLALCSVGLGGYLQVLPGLKRPN